MSRYYFHVIDDIDTPDDEGADLPDVDAARQWAISAARALMSETLTVNGSITLSHRIEIEDEQHGIVGSVVFRDALRILP